MFKAIKNHPLATFYILTFILAWCIKIPVVIFNTNNIVLRLLPSFFPAMAALLTTAIIAGRQGIRDLLRPVMELSKPPIWYLIALIGPMALYLLAIALAIPFGGAFPTFVLPGIRLLPVLLVAIFFALGEELGWRGFALPRLQSRFNPLFASLIVGLLWWSWHLPEALAGSDAGISPQQIINLELRDLVLDLAASILMTWIYNNTNKSVFLITLFHVGIGLTGQFLVTPSTPNVSPLAILFDVLLCIAATMVVLLNKPANVTDKKPAMPGIYTSPPEKQSSTALTKDEI